MNEAFDQIVNDYVQAIRQCVDAILPLPDIDRETFDGDREGIRRACDDLREMAGMRWEPATLLPKVFFLEGSFLRLLAMAAHPQTLDLVAKQLWNISAALL